jgi:hypothetical protein
MYAAIAELCRGYGYALAIHGSLARDCDLLAVPWIDHPADHAPVLQAILHKFHWELTAGPTRKPHGRVAYTLHALWGDVYLDLQFMPALLADGAPHQPVAAVPPSYTESG